MGDAGVLREAWGSWISQQPWDLFVTMTPDHRTHPEALYKRFRYCAATWESHVYGRQRKPAGHTLSWLFAHERFKSGQPHGHALVRFPLVDLRGQAGKAIFDLEQWKAWSDSTGGFCRLELPQSQQHVVNYVTKYVVKGGDMEWSPSCDFAREAWRQLQMPPAAEAAAMSRARGRPAESLTAC